MNKDEEAVVGAVERDPLGKISDDNWWSIFNTGLVGMAVAVEFIVIGYYIAQPTAIEHIRRDELTMAMGQFVGWVLWH